ncbi:hypothetical protein HDU98_012151 [Podochytrium sp. JEL0797]|nr:hypothetical protein HDU98_012151 [Podochytrium sp. JEL0797]
MSADLTTNATNALKTLPTCAYGCVAAIPGFSTSLTQAVITQICGEWNTILPVFNTCVKDPCPLAKDLSDITTAVTNFEGVCAQLSTNPSFQATGSASITSPPAVGTATSSSTVTGSVLQQSAGSSATPYSSPAVSPQADGQSSWTSQQQQGSGAKRVVAGVVGVAVGLWLVVL